MSFIDKSQPPEPGDGDYAGEQQAPPPPKPVELIRVDPELQARIKTRMATEKLSQSEVARSARVSASLLNKWLLNKPEGDLATLEFKLNRWEAEYDNRIDLRRENKPTIVTDWVGKVITTVYRTADLGVLTGPAGVGKTCGIELFCADNPAAILLTAGQLHGSAAAMVDDLWDKSHSRRRQAEKGKQKSDILIERFKFSGAPILIDEFDKLTRSGLGWVKAFYDATGCPMLLNGNEKGLDNIKAMPNADQFTSRIGQKRDVGKIFKGDAVADLAGLIVRQFAPQYIDQLFGVATKVCAQKGHGRRLKKQLRLMLEILDGGLDKKSDYIARQREQGLTEVQIAFTLAASQLLTLEDE